MWRRCFFKKEFLEDSRCSSQKRFISSSSIFLANSRPFFTVSMPLRKRIYGLDIFDVQMDLPILSELEEVGQHRTGRVRR